MARDPHQQAADLADKGYGPLAIPHGAKHPPPTGTTGADPMPTYRDWLDTIEREPHRANVGVRLPAGTVGVDVDGYDTKTGGDTWAALNEGDPFPNTIVVSARFGPGYDGISGIRLYRLPEGMDETTLWGSHGGVEIIRTGHRYLMGPGATHPNGEQYRAFDVPVKKFRDDLPHPAVLPQLSPAQAARLTKNGAPWATRAHKAAHPGQGTLAASGLRTGLDDLPPGPPCPRMETLTADAIRDIDNGEQSRHDRMTQATYAILAAASEGHRGGNEALHTLRRVFVTSIADRASREEAAAEYSRAVGQAMAKIPTVDPLLQACCDTTALPSLPTAPGGSEGLEGYSDTEATAESLRDALTAHEDILRNSPTYKKIVIERAIRRLVDSDETTARWTPPNRTPRTPRLHEPDTPTPWRIHGLWPERGKVLLSAAAKAGKTTLGLNLDRSLLAGTPFLGKFETNPTPGTVCVLDLEMTRNQLRTWYKSLDDIPTDRLVLFPLRGQGQTLDLRKDHIRNLWANTLRDQGCTTLRLDPIGPVLAALAIDENDNSAVASYLAALDALTVEIGADLIVAHHYGHSGRTRGASALLGWADALWDLAKKETQANQDPIDGLFDTRPRSFRAEGRDVDLPEHPLQYDPQTRLLSLGQPAMRREEKARQEIDLAMEILLEHGTLGAREFAEIYIPKARAKNLRTSTNPRAHAYATALEQIRNVT
jgi:hypothetical protein